jgi:hypothetical protein
LYSFIFYGYQSSDFVNPLYKKLENRKSKEEKFLDSNICHSNGHVKFKNFNTIDYVKKVKFENESVNAEKKLISNDINKTKSIIKIPKINIERINTLNSLNSLKTIKSNKESDSFITLQKSSNNFSNYNLKNNKINIIEKSNLGDNSLKLPVYETILTERRDGTSRINKSYLNTNNSYFSKQASTFREKNKFIQTVISDFVKTSENLSEKIKHTNHDRSLKESKIHLQEAIQKYAKKNSLLILNDKNNKNTHSTFIPQIKERKVTSMIVNTLEKDPIKMKINKEESLMQLDTNQVYKFRKIITEKFDQRDKFTRSRILDKNSYNNQKNARNRQHHLVEDILAKNDRYRFNISNRLDKFISKL